MARLFLGDPDAVPMDLALARSFAAFDCEPLGGQSGDGWSKIGDLQRCPYRYYLRHEIGAIPVGASSPSGSAALEIGGLTHALLALHYCRMLPAGYPGSRKNPPPPLDFLDRVQAAGADIHFVSEARRLFYGYLEHYGVEDIHPVAIEYQAGIPGVHTCRFDMLAWKDGQLWNVEHKTASAETADVMNSWWLDGEIIGEVYGWKLSGLDKVFGAPLAGVMINMLFKTKPVRYRRLEVVIPDNVLAQYEQDRRFWAASREHFRKTGYWPRALHGCMSRYDLCLFWDHCRDADANLIKIRETPRVT